MQVPPRASEKEVQKRIFYQQYKMFQRRWNKEREKINCVC